MKSITTLKSALAISALFVTGCATSKPALQGQLNPDAGSAVKANIAAHAVAPSAASKANTFIPADATRARAARENYKNNTIPEPERINQDQD